MEIVRYTMTRAKIKNLTYGMLRVLIAGHIATSRIMPNNVPRDLVHTLRSRIVLLPQYPKNAALIILSGMSLH